MAGSRDLESFSELVYALRQNATLARVLDGDFVDLNDLTVPEVAQLVATDAGYYFLIAAARLNRTSLRKAQSSERAQIVARPLRRAYAIHEHLPNRERFREIASRAIALRAGDLTRRSGGSIEALFRERIAYEGIPILMSPPRREVPGLLIGRRKPDGVYPDPATHAAPGIYLEVKNVRRVADDIQKRLYEIAEASLEMKYLYGSLEVKGLNLRSTEAIDSHPLYRAVLRDAIRASFPIVVALLICPRAEAERYRVGAETFLDRVFFQEEVDECLEFLREAVARVDEHAKS